MRIKKVDLDMGFFILRLCLYIKKKHEINLFHILEKFSQNFIH